MLVFLVMGQTHLNTVCVLVPDLYHAEHESLELSTGRLNPCKNTSHRLVLRHIYDHLHHHSTAHVSLQQRMNIDCELQFIACYLSVTGEMM